MKKTLVFMLLFLFIVSQSLTAFAKSDNNSEAERYDISNAEIEVSSRSAVLMEASSGEIIYSKNENEALSPASVTKIMTLLLVMEAIDEGRILLDSNVPISAYASSMGGSQVFLKEGENMSVRDLIKCTVIASANDAAVALSEYVYGSEDAFVKAMNEKARALNMTNTNFENTTGLDDTCENHFTSAMDIAIMSRELMKHSLIFEYSSLWQDSIRNGEFILTNTNRLVRYYDGCTGLKTGSTDKAGYCISATAERNGTKLIAVIMGAPTRDERNSIARSLLDFGFSNYAVYSEDETEISNVDLYGAKNGSITLYSEPIVKLIYKKHLGKVEKYYDIPEYLEAPIAAGDTVGSVKYVIDGKVLYENEIYVKTDAKRLSVGDIFVGIIKNILTGKFN